MTKICLPPGGTGLHGGRYSDVSAITAETLLPGGDVGHDDSVCNALALPETPLPETPLPESPPPAAPLAEHGARVTRWPGVLRGLFGPMTRDERRRGGGWGGDDD